MRFLKLISLVLAASIAVSLGASKFAVVRLTDIYRDLPSTAALQKGVQEQREAIMKNERAEHLRRVIAELQLLQSELQDNSARTEDQMAALGRSFELKRQEAETMRREFEDFRVEENKRINREMVEGMRALLSRIHEASVQIAKERNFDGVFDSSGNSNTGTQVMLYHKDAPDLTEDVMGLLLQAEQKEKEAEVSEELTREEAE